MALSFKKALYQQRIHQIFKKYYSYKCAFYAQTKCRMHQIRIKRLLNIIFFGLSIVVKTRLWRSNLFKAEFVKIKFYAIQNEILQKSRIPCHNFLNTKNVLFRIIYLKYSNISIQTHFSWFFGDFCIWIVLAQKLCFVPYRPFCFWHFSSLLAYHELYFHYYWLHFLEPFAAQHCLPSFKIDISWMDSFEKSL